MGIFHRHSSALRKQLFVLILIIFIPISTIILLSEYYHYRHNIGDIDKNAKHMIRLFSKEQLNIINQTRQFLTVISSVPAIQNLHLPECNRFLHELHRTNRQYSTIVAADKDGLIDCCAIPLKQTIDVKDRN